MDTEEDDALLKSPSVVEKFLLMLNDRVDGLHQDIINLSESVKRMSKTLEYLESNLSTHWVCAVFPVRFDVVLRDVDESLHAAYKRMVRIISGERVLLERMLVKPIYDQRDPNCIRDVCVYFKSHAKYLLSFWNTTINDKMLVDETIDLYFICKPMSMHHTFAPAVYWKCVQESDITHWSGAYHQKTMLYEYPIHIMLSGPPSDSKNMMEDNTNLYNIFAQIWGHGDPATHRQHAINKLEQALRTITGA